jgi:hypothetical protein
MPFMPHEENLLRDIETAQALATMYRKRGDRQVSAMLLNHVGDLRRSLARKRRIGVDMWGRPLVTSSDGHTAWTCNDFTCRRHPESLYGR